MAAVTSEVPSTSLRRLSGGGGHLGHEHPQVAFELARRIPSSSDPGSASARARPSTAWASSTSPLASIDGEFFATRPP